MDADWEEVQSALRAGVPIMIGDGEPTMRLVISSPSTECITPRCSRLGVGWRGFPL